MGDGSASAAANTVQQPIHHLQPPPTPNLELKSPIPLSFSSANGCSSPILKRHNPASPPLYRECLRNHAASLGGHALDGCGEFMLSPSSCPSVPSSLTCAACGCHRNFHRRLPSSPSPSSSPPESDSDDPLPFSSAPHMLMALRSAPPQPPRKRSRTRFSPEQKERMHQLSERLGWRLHKRDDSLVDDCCRQIGVGKGVFKVWMHNNKHAFSVFSPRPRPDPPDASSSPGDLPHTFANGA